MRVTPVRHPNKTTILLLALLSSGVASGTLLTAGDQDPDNTENSTAIVRQVVDGDTIDVTLNGNEETQVRLLCVSTELSVRPDRNITASGRKASIEVRKWLKPGMEVTLEIERERKHDPYGRLQAYVILPSEQPPAKDQRSQNLNLRLVQLGYAVYDTLWGRSAKYHFQFEQAEKSAQGGKLGIWKTDVSRKAYLQYKNRRPAGEDPPPEYSGTWVTWDFDDTRTAQNFKKGAKHGTFTEASHDGSKRVGQYENGKRSGTWIAWHSNGRLAARESYRHGTEDGEWEIWHDNGLPAFRGRFAEGKKVGLHTTWYRDGVKKEEMTFNEDGKLTGNRQSWFPNGQKQRQNSYRDGREEGRQVTWHLTIPPEYEECTFKEGMRVGWETRWDRNGGLVCRHFYEEGRLERTEIPPLRETPRKVSFLACSFDDLLVAVTSQRCYFVREALRAKREPIVLRNLQIGGATRKGEHLRFRLGPLFDEDERIVVLQRQASEVSVARIHDDPLTHEETESISREDFNLDEVATAFLKTANFKTQMYLFKASAEKFNELIGKGNKILRTFPSASEHWAKWEKDRELALGADKRIIEALESLIGKTVMLETSKGEKEGIVSKIEDGAIFLQRSDKAGEDKIQVQIRVPLSELTEKERAKRKIP